MDETYDIHPSTGDKRLETMTYGKNNGRVVLDSKHTFSHKYYYCQS